MRSTDELLAQFDGYLQVFRREGRTMKKLSMTRGELSSLLSDTEAEAHCEAGSRVNRLHMHALVSMSHHSDINLRVNLAKLRADLPPGTYLNVRYVKDSNFSLREYIRKNQH